MPSDLAAGPRWGTRPWRAAIGDRALLGEGQLVLHSLDGRALVVWGGEPVGQPTWAADEQSAVVLDGVLYRRGELASSLGLAEAAEPDDAALALAAWRRWGDGCVERLRGVFGLLVWDAESDHLVLMRVVMVM